MVEREGGVKVCEGGMVIGVGRIENSRLYRTLDLQATALQVIKKGNNTWRPL
jgi:hypothetical protein